MHSCLRAPCGNATPFDVNVRPFPRDIAAVLRASTCKECAAEGRRHAHCIHHLSSSRTAVVPSSTQDYCYLWPSANRFSGLYIVQTISPKALKSSLIRAWSASPIWPYLSPEAYQCCVKSRAPTAGSLDSSPSCSSDVPWLGSPQKPSRLQSIVVHRIGPLALSLIVPFCPPTFYSHSLSRPPRPISPSTSCLARARPLHSLPPSSHTLPRKLTQTTDNIATILPSGCHDDRGMAFVA